MREGERERGRERGVPPLLEDLEVCANLYGCAYYYRIVIKILDYCLGLFSVAYEHILLSWQLL